MKRILLLLLVAACVRPPPPGTHARGGREVTIVHGIGPGGEPSMVWVTMLKDGWGIDEAARSRSEAHPFTVAERAWVTMFEESLPRWLEGVPALEVPFGIWGPDRFRVMIGNVGGADGFTDGDRTIAINVGEMVRVYGETPDRERALRIVSHEYTHLLTHRLMRKKKWPTSTPLERALWTGYHEGFGNYRSLSSKWIDARGGLTPNAEATLARLGPVFVERIEALAKGPDAAEEARLMEGMAAGRFEDKWGALPVALWLAAEARGDDRRLRKWGKAGPRGVLALARRHLPAELAARLP